MAAAEPSKNVTFILDVPFYHGWKPVDVRVGVKSHEAKQRLPDGICPAPDCRFLLHRGGPLSREGLRTCPACPGVRPAPLQTSARAFSGAVPPEPSRGCASRVNSSSRKTWHSLFCFFNPLIILIPTSSCSPRVSHHFSSQRHFLPVLACVFPAGL